MLLTLLLVSALQVIGGSHEVYISWLSVTVTDLRLACKDPMM